MKERETMQNKINCFLTNFFCYHVLISKFEQVCYSFFDLL